MRENSIYNADKEFAQADRYIKHFIEIGLVQYILTNIQNYARQNVVTNLLKILTYCCTNRDCKAFILRNDGFQVA